MSNNMVLFQQQGGAVAPLSSKFQAMVQAGIGMDLGEGVRSSYGIIGIKGARFNLRYKGETRVLDMPHPQDATQRLPVSFIDVVIVKANGFLNKQYYEGSYTEGSDSAPDCYSLNGKTPSPQVPQPQHTNCALCPMNQFGSKIGDNGAKQKACRDTKKLAIVPLADIRNASMGGAMLFRVPPSALKDLSVMSDALKGRGYPYNSVAVRIGFDTTVSHPKPTFQALRPLTDDEADLVLEMFSSDSVESVLADGDDATPIQPVQGPVQTHGWQPGQPLPARNLAEVPPVNPAAAQPVPQMRPQILNQPAFPADVQVVAVGAGRPVQTATAFMPATAAAVITTLQVAPDSPPESLSAPAPLDNSVAQTPAGNPFAAPPGVQAQPIKEKAIRRAPVHPVAAPAAPSEPAPSSVGQLDDEISAILGGLGEFMGGGK